VTPNLNDNRPRQHATHCRALANPPSRDHLSGPEMFRLDDLRECEHGRIQIVAKTNGRMQGPGTWAWEDLPKLFNRRQWNHARQLLDKESQQATQTTGPHRDLNAAYFSPITAESRHRYDPPQAAPTSLRTVTKWGF
jgi:hypothetical protein